MSTLAVGTIKSVSSALPVFQNSSGVEKGTLIKAFCRYDNSGTITINDSFNISSIADIGTGDATLTFATAMSNDDYCWSYVSGIGMWNGTESYATTTTLRIRGMTRADSYTNADSDVTAVIVAGDN
jgi:hypothetical protein